MAFQVTTNITDAQEAALTQLLNLYVARGILPEPAPTPQVYLEGRIAGVLAELRGDYLQERAHRLKLAMAAATEQDIAAAESALGIT